MHFLEDEATATEMREVELSDQTRERGMHQSHRFIHMFIYFCRKQFFQKLRIRQSGR